MHGACRSRRHAGKEERQPAPAWYPDRIVAAIMLSRMSGDPVVGRCVNL
jgi:hypothetical protein